MPGRVIACPGCGKHFFPKKRGDRRQRTCSLACHLATRRDYSGINNPNYRGTNEHVCGRCGARFHGKRPKGKYAGTYCSSSCAALATLSNVGGTVRSRFNKRDMNEPELLEVARKLGAEWWEGPPLDGWVILPGGRGFMPVEIKQPSRKGKAREFQPSQLKFFESCRVAGSRYWVWYTIDDVIRDLNPPRHGLVRF